MKLRCSAKEARVAARLSLVPAAMTLLLEADSQAGDLITGLGAIQRLHAGTLCARSRGNGEDSPLL